MATRLEVGSIPEIAEEARRGAFREVWRASYLISYAPVSVGEEEINTLFTAINSAKEVGLTPDEIYRAQSSGADTGFERSARA